jgi:hypothetical protein
MNRAFTRQLLQVLLGAACSSGFLCACMFSATGCQQAAAAQSAVTAVNTAQTAITQAPKVAQTAVQTAANTATGVVNAVPGAPQALQAGQSAVSAVQTTAGNAAQTAGNAMVNNVPGVAEAVQGGQTVVATAQNAGQTVAQTSVNAINAVPGGQVALNAVPKPILDVVYRIVTLNKMNWGNPQAVYVVDGRYIFVYPSNSIPIIQKSQPRVIIVDSMSQVARLQRLEKYGY